jgi:hypothetical protein
MNPLAIFSWFVLRIVGIADVNRYWFAKRRLRHCIVQGPGSLMIHGEKVTIHNCKFTSCDFIMLPEGTKLYAAHTAESIHAEHVNFRNLTICATEPFITALVKDCKDISTEPVKGRNLLPVRI